MTQREPARPMTRPIPRILFATLLVVIVAITVLGQQLLASSSSMAAGPIDMLRPGRPGDPGEADGAIPDRATASTAAVPSGGPRGEHRGALDEDDGAIPDGTTALDDEIPGVANLDPSLLGALRRAATVAADDGVDLFVKSGWRSAKYQERLLREAIPKYGSEKEAARWVATPETSAHVSGDAVDIGPLDAAAWLSDHGARYGLCQIYRNEPWHYELRPEAIDHGCPPIYADPTRDPRMRH